MSGTDATRCKVCGGPFSEKRVIIDGCAYHQRCAVMSYPSHTHEDYQRLSDAYSVAMMYLERLATRACDEEALAFIRGFGVGHPVGSSPDRGK